VDAQAKNQDTDSSDKQAEPEAQPVVMYPVPTHPMFMFPAKKVVEKPAKKVFQSLTESQINTLNE
jgi:hypothetical protein